MNHTTRYRDGARLAHTPVPRRWAKEPDHSAGIIEIEMPRRSIEHVALADGTCRGLPAVTAPTEDSGAAAREYSLLRTQSPTCGK